MASNFGRKKESFGQKVGGTLKRIFMLSALGATFIGAPAYYEYGTMHQGEFKLKDVQSNYVSYDQSKGEAIYDYKLVTAQGMVFENHNSLLHLKFNSKDMQDQVSSSRTPPSQPSDYSSIFNFNSSSNDTPAKPADPLDDPANKVYRISYYGARIDVPFIHTFPNVLSVQEIPKEELQARAQAVQDARKAAAAHQKQQQQQAAQQPGQQPAANGTTQAPATTGALITFDTVVNGQDVNLTVPAAAVDKVKVNSVTPVVPRAPGS